MDLDKWNIREFRGSDDEFNDLYKLEKPILIFDKVPNDKTLT